MGQKNNVICSYLSDPAVFADFINGCIHNGERVVSPEQLMDREAVSCFRETPSPGTQPPKGPRYIQRQRDALKAVFGSDRYIVVGIEAQNKVDYAMPVRCMEYDITEYKRQLKELKNNLNGRENDPRGDRFISGMAKEEKLNPVTTIVFYHGEEPYDGCENLHDMLELDKENQTYKRFVADYHMNLVKANDLDETRFETGMQELVGFLKRQGSKAELMDYVEQNRERIENMDEETFDAVSILMQLPKKVLKMRKNREGGRTGMCTAMKEWLADERNVGREEGIKEGEKRGEKRGEKIGVKKGENRFASLTAALMHSERLDDLNRAVLDETFRDSLYREFAL